MHAGERARSGLWDMATTVAIGVAALVGYGSTLAPTVLDGDAALFQFLPSVVGVAYPTGYPTYILLSRIWQTILPLGSVAWRINALSACCGALALVFVFRAYAYWLNSRLGGFVATLLFGTLPTYWRWSTEPKSYTLNILLLALMLFVISRVDRRRASGKSGNGRGFVWLAVLFGLSLGNHNTTLLLAPGLVLLYWLHGGRQKHGSVWRLGLSALPFVVIPVGLYTLIPLRADALLAQAGTVAGLTVPAAVARGWVSDFYTPGWAGLARYFAATDFTGGVVSNWGAVPAQLVSVYWPLIKADFGIWGALLCAFGAVLWAFAARRRFWPLFLVFVVPIPFVLTYGQGEQSAFLLPSNLMLAGFGGAAAGAIWRRWKRIVPRNRAWLASASKVVMAGALLVVGCWLPMKRASQNVRWLQGKWSSSQERYWRNVLAHPIEQDAGLMAHWGDLTTMWYLQNVDHIRPDVFGLFPPSQEAAEEWLSAGRALYVAGPLQEWGEDVPSRFQVVPWGRVVRLLPTGDDAAEVLPTLNALPAPTRFGGKVVLEGHSFPSQARGGQIFPVTLRWSTVDAVPTTANVSIRFIGGDDNVMFQWDDALFSGWLPEGDVAAGRAFLSQHAVPVPAGSWPGHVRLEIAVFDDDGEWPDDDGEPAVPLGELDLLPQMATSERADPWEEYKPRGDSNFGGQIRLVGYDYSVTRAGQGKGFVARFLWETLQPPAADYTLLVELVDTEDSVLREWRQGGDVQMATSSWRAGQLVREQVDLVLPADTPPGDASISMRLAWLAPDGSPIPVRRWGLLPAGRVVSLPGVRVVEKEGRVFEVPALERPVQADFGGKIRLLGLNDMPSGTILPGETVAADLVWQSLVSDMDVSYTVFVHLIDSDGRVVAQGDKVPGFRSKQPTTGWVTGEVVVDPISVVVPEDVAPGMYVLNLGLYEAPAGQRLPVLDESGNIVSDSLDALRVEVGTRQSPDTQ